MEAPQKIEYGQVLEVFPYKATLPDGGMGKAIGGVGGAIVGVAAGVATQSADVLVYGTQAGASAGSRSGGSVVVQRRETVYVLLENGTEISVDQPENKPKLKRNSEVKVLTYQMNVQRVCHRDQQVEWESNPYERAQ